MHPPVGVKRVLWTALADATFAVHLALVLIVAVGWLVPGLYWVYLALLAATLYSELVLKYCPLTRLEFGIRRRLDPGKAYDKSCIMHYGRALFGLAPRPLTPPSGDRSLLKRHGFLIVLGGLFAISVAYRLLFA